MDRFTFDDLYVRRLKEHDREIEDHFANYFGGVLLAKLRGRLPPQAIPDLIQDVLLCALSKLDELREGCKLGAFVLGICNNMLKEQYRTVTRTEPLDERHLQIRDRLNIEEELLRKEAAVAVRNTLSRMRKHRELEVLLAVYLDEVPRDEVCRRHKVSDKNLRVVLHRAMKKFKTAFRRKNKPEDF